MSEHYFTVVLPMYKRPALARQALTSVLAQSFDDIEIILSNNGNDPEVAKAVEDLIGDPRVRYLTFDDPLSMPDHWDHLVGLATGRYVTILPDRSVLYPDALAEVYAAHQVHPGHRNVVGWAWDIYHEDAGLLQERKAQEPKVRIVNSDDLMIDQMHAPTYPQTLPRGLNSCVAREMIEDIRAKNGVVFGPISPDFSFAYNCLMREAEFAFITRSLMVSQGLSDSNGSRMRLTDMRSYLALFGEAELFDNVPCDAPIVENAIFQDFLLSAEQNGRGDLAARIGPEVYYSKCMTELRLKRLAKLLPVAEIDAFEASLMTALDREPADVQARVRAVLGKRPPLKSWLRVFLKGKLGPQVEAWRPMFMRLKGARGVPSVLDAVAERQAKSG